MLPCFFPYFLGFYSFVILIITLRQGGGGGGGDVVVKVEPASKMSLVSEKYHEPTAGKFAAAVQK